MNKNFQASLVLMRIGQILLAIYCFGTCSVGWASAVVSSGTLTSDGMAQGTYEWATENNPTVICFESSCSVAICSYNSGSPCINPGAYGTLRVVVNRGATVIDAQRVFTAQNGVSGSWRMVAPSKPSYDLCFGMMVFQGPQAFYNTTGKLIPGTYCSKVPPTPPVTSCNILNNVVFNYGPLSAGSVDGSSKNNFITIECSRDANVYVTLNGQPNLPLGGGITSKLFINSQELSSWVRILVPQGTSSYTITSRLYSSGDPEAGDYSGSGILIISYQ